MHFEQGLADARSSFPFAARWTKLEVFTDKPL
jgi:hypothetical protein